MSEFSDFYVKQIEEDLDWREKELAILRKQLFQTSLGSPQERTFLRTNLAMIYAHYEGFCKFALGVYIDALERLALKRIELKWPIASQSLKKLHVEMRSIADPVEFFTKIFTAMDSHFKQTAEYERPDNIANLWPDLLMRWQTNLGLQCISVLNEKTRLDTLVKCRNQIAHGKKLTVANRAELDKHSHVATLAMHEVAIGIADALEKQLYSRNSQVMTILPHAVV